MAAPTKTPDGPLKTAAGALEAELRQYEETVAELDRLQLTSEKSLQRARRVLEECAAHQEKLATLLPAFASAMQAAQERQQQCMEQTARTTERIKTRFEERVALLQRIAALGERAQTINEPAMAVIGKSAEERTVAELSSSLADVGERTDAAIAEADAVHQAAQDGEWLDIARDADGLRQQLRSARNKVLIAQRQVAARAPS